MIRACFGELSQRQATHHEIIDPKHDEQSAHNRREALILWWWNDGQETAIHPCLSSPPLTHEIQDRCGTKRARPADENDVERASRQVSERF